MWLGQSGFANVISIGTLEELCRRNGGNVNYNGEVTGGAFIADLGNGTVVTFTRCPDTDFPFINLDEQCNEDGAVMLLQTVQTNMEGYTKKEVTRAVHARDAQTTMACINEGDLKAEASGKILRSSGISCADIANSKNIFGPSAHQIIRGKQTRRKPSRVEPNYLSIPVSITERYKYLTLVVDAMFVCGMPFFVSLSRGVRFVIA